MILSPYHVIVFNLRCIRYDMTYEKAQTIYKKCHDKTVKTCWIADVKRKHGKTKHQSWNRIGIKPKYPCPVNVFPKLEKILKELKMI